MHRRNSEYKAMKSRFLKFLNSGGNNLRRRTFRHVVPEERKRTLTSLAVFIAVLVTLFVLQPTTPTRAINGFSTNQELPLPALAPIGPAPVAFIVRGLEPSVRVAPDGTVYVSSIRGVPGGVDLHRYYQPTDCPL